MATKSQTCSVFLYKSSCIWFILSIKSMQAIATHSSILAWRIPWKEEPAGLESMGSQRVRLIWTNPFAFNTFQPSACKLPWNSAHWDPFWLCFAFQISYVYKERLCWPYSWDYSAFISVPITSNRSIFYFAHWSREFFNAWTISPLRLCKRVE